MVVAVIVVDVVTVEIVAMIAAMMISGDDDFSFVILSFRFAPIVSRRESGQRSEGKRKKIAGRLGRWLF